MERNRRCGVIGSGIMGSGIAQVMAQTGYTVVLMDAVPEALDRAVASIQRSLGRMVRKGTLGEEQVPGILERIIRATKPDGLREAQIIIESVPEDGEVKREIFQRLDEVTAPDCISLAPGGFALFARSVAP